MAVALTTMATLVLELALTRIFSVVFYYHFAFLAISIALFGLGAGGVLSYYVTGHGASLFRKLGLLSALNALAVTGSLALILRLGGTEGFWTLAAVYFAAAAPFLLSGMVVSLAIAETIERVDRVYFVDLLGAAGGCLLLIPFLNIVGGPGTVLTAAVLLAASSAVWFGLGRSVTGRAAGVVLALALVMLVVANKQAHWLDIHTAKGRELSREEFVQWNSFSRIAVTRDAWNWPLIAIDADATTGIAQFDFDNLAEEDRARLKREGPAFPYLLRPGAKALVVGAGGGWDVARALASGSKDVTAVEINPIIATTIMRGRYLELSRGLYLRPEVRVFVEDGRSFIRRTDEKFDVLQATLVDTWASTAAGAYALSENNLYTVEAFTDYFSHLTDTGILAFTRWGFDPPRESLRLLSLSREALARLGEREAWRHVLVLRESAEKLEGWGATDTVVVSRRPLSAHDLERAREAAAHAGLTIIYEPGTNQPTPFRELLTAADPRAFYASYPFNVAPVTDDRPFFFYTVQPRDVLGFGRAASRGSADFKINQAVPTLFSLLGVSAVAVTVTLLLPPLLLRRRLPARARRAAVPRLLHLPRRRLHPGAGGPHSETRSVSRPPDLRPHRGHLLDARLQRPRQLLEPPPDAGQRPAPARDLRDRCRPGGAHRGHRRAAHRAPGGPAPHGEDRSRRPAHRARGLLHGHPLPRRAWRAWSSGTGRRCAGPGA
jgi:predicted membrane-bound spermidine synthase